MMSATAAFPVVATLAPKGTVVILGVLAVLGAVQAYEGKALSTVFPKAATVLAGLILVWLSIKAFHTQIETDGISRLLKFTLLLVLSFFAASYLRKLDSDQRSFAFRACWVGTLLAMLTISYSTLAIELHWYHPFIVEGRSDLFSVLSTGLIACSAILPTLLIPLWRKGNRMIPLSFAAFVLIIAALTGTLAVTVALITAIAATVFCAFLGSKRGSRFIAIALVTIVFALPAALGLQGERIAEELIPRDQSGNVQKSAETLGSITHRLEIWRFTAIKAMEAPLTGWGFDASRVIPGGNQELDVGKELLPLHPHNGVLQIWLELGILGLALFAISLWMAVASKTESADRLTGNLTRVAVVVFLFAIGNATFGIWQSWWIATFVIAFALTTINTSTTSSHGEHGATSS